MRGSASVAARPDERGGTCQGWLSGSPWVVPVGAISLLELARESFFALLDSVEHVSRGTRRVPNRVSRGTKSPLCGVQDAKRMADRARPPQHRENKGRIRDLPIPLPSTGYSSNDAHESSLCRQRSDEAAPLFHVKPFLFLLHCLICLQATPQRAV